MALFGALSGLHLRWLVGTSSQQVSWQEKSWLMLLEHPGCLGGEEENPQPPENEGASGTAASAIQPTSPCCLLQACN